MWTTRTNLTLVAAGLLALGACDSGESDITGPTDGSSAVSGSVENETEPASAAPAASPSSSSGSYAAAQASTVAVAAVSSNGSLDVLAEADVQADGRFIIEGVPAGRSGLIVTARTSSGDEVGRTLVHGSTEANATIVTEPINAETTVEGQVYQEVAASGASDEIRSTARLALFVRLDEATAAQVAASARSIQEIAAAYRASADARTRVFAQAGADMSAQAEALAQAALSHASRRDAGVSAEAAHEAFVQATLDAYAQSGVDAEDVSLATAVAAGLDQTAAVTDEQARVDIARSAVMLHLAAREELAADLSASQADEKAVVLSALADARVGVDAAVSIAEIANTLVETEAQAEAELISLVMARVPTDVSAEVRADIQGKLETAFAEADLSANIDGSISIGSLVQALLAYRVEVRSAVDALVAALPSEVSLGAEATTRLLIAASGGPAVGS